MRLLTTAGILDGFQPHRVAEARYTCPLGAGSSTVARAQPTEADVGRDGAGDPREDKQIAGGFEGSGDLPERTGLADMDKLELSSGPVCAHAWDVRKSGFSGTVHADLRIEVAGEPTIAARDELTSSLDRRLDPSGAERSGVDMRNDDTAGEAGIVQIIGRSSSHFTRVPLVFAHELGVAFELVPIHDMTVVDPAVYAGNPALKLPTLRRAGSLVFGAENICRTLAEVAQAKLRIVWPEELRTDVARNAQELVWHGMTAQVQLAFGTVVAKLPADNIYFAKARQGFEGALGWLDGNLESVLSALPSPRDLSLLEVALFCLVEHLSFRGTVSVQPYPSLVRFAEGFATRPSAQRTRYRFDPPPEASTRGPRDADKGDGLGA